MAGKIFYFLSALDRCACTEEWRALRETLSQILPSSRNETVGSFQFDEERVLQETLAACAAAHGGVSSYVATTSKTQAALPFLAKKYQETAVGLYAAEAKEEAVRRVEVALNAKEGCERDGQTDVFNFTAMLADLIGFCPSLVDSLVRPLFRGGMPLPVGLRKRIWTHRLDVAGATFHKQKAGDRRHADTVIGGSTSPTSDVDHVIRRLAKLAIGAFREDNMKVNKNNDENGFGEFEEKLVQVSRIFYLNAHETKPFRPYTVLLAHFFAKVFSTDAPEVIASRLSLLVNGDSPSRTNYRYLPSPSLTSPYSARLVSRKLITALDPPMQSNLVALDGLIPNAEAWNALNPVSVVNNNDARQISEPWKTNQPEMEFLARRFGLSAVIKMSEKAAASVSGATEETAIARTLKFWTAEEMVASWLCRGFVGVLPEECALYCWDQCFLHGFQLLPAFAAVILRLLRVPIAHAARSLQGELEEEHEGFVRGRSDTLGAVKYAFLIMPREITLADLVKAVREGKGSGIVQDDASGCS